MIVVTVFGTGANALTIMLFTRFASIKSRITTLQRSLAVADLIMALFGAGMFALNCFHHRQSFGLKGTTLHCLIICRSHDDSLSHSYCYRLQSQWNHCIPGWLHCYSSFCCYIHWASNNYAQPIVGGYTEGAHASLCHSNGGHLLDLWNILVNHALVR